MRSGGADGRERPLPLALPPPPARPPPPAGAPLPPAAVPTAPLTSAGSRPAARLASPRPPAAAGRGPSRARPLPCGCRERGAGAGAGLRGAARSARARGGGGAPRSAPAAADSSAGSGPGWGGEKRCRAPRRRPPGTERGRGLRAEPGAGPGGAGGTLSRGELFRAGVPSEGCGEGVSPRALPAPRPPPPARRRRQRSPGVTAFLPQVQPRICGFWRRKGTGGHGCAAKQGQTSR